MTYFRLRGKILKSQWLGHFKEHIQISLALKMKKKILWWNVTEKCLRSEKKNEQCQSKENMWSKNVFAYCCFFYCNYENLISVALFFSSLKYHNGWKSTHLKFGWKFSRHKYKKIMNECHFAGEIKSHWRNIWNTTSKKKASASISRFKNTKSEWFFSPCIFETEKMSVFFHL